MSSVAAAEARRIIPADAGSTGFGLNWVGHAEDHPRGCGEHIDTRGAGRVKHGSSPRMRGARDE